MTIWIAIVYGTSLEVNSKATFVLVAFTANNADEWLHRNRRLFPRDEWMVIHKITIWIAIIYGTFREVSSKTSFIFIFFAANNADEFFYRNVCLRSSHLDRSCGIYITELGASATFGSPFIPVGQRFCCLKCLRRLLTLARGVTAKNTDHSR